MKTKSLLTIIFGFLLTGIVNSQTVNINISMNGTRKINKLIFGSNINWVQNGDGLYKVSLGSAPDTVIQLIKKLGITSLRYPGGTLAEKFDWKQSIGNKAQRGYSLDYSGHAHQIVFGLEEFLNLCERLNVEPIITVGFVNNTNQNILDLLEYCNGAPTTQFGKMRAENGHIKPYNVKYWEIGNEVYYNKLAIISSALYASRTLEIEKAMKSRDPSIMVGAILSNEDYDWDTTVIKICASNSDFFVVHEYYPGDKFQTRKQFEDIYIGSTKYMAENIQSLLNYSKQYNAKIKLAVSEYNYFLNKSQESFINNKTPDLYEALEVGEFIRIFLTKNILFANKWLLANYNVHKFADINFNKGEYISLAPSYFVQKTIFNADIDSLVKLSITSPNVVLQNYRKQNNIIAPIVTAFAGKNKKENKIIIFIINRGNQAYDNAQINISNFNIDNVANYILIQSKNDVDTGEAKISSGKYALTINNNSFNLRIPALSFSKYVFNLKQ